MPTLSLMPNNFAGISVTDNNACFSVKPFSIAVRIFVQKSLGLSKLNVVKAKLMPAFSSTPGLVGANSHAFIWPKLTFLASAGSSTSKALTKLIGIIKLAPVALTASMR
ncbi:hypothetical protein D9M68_480500 [compost metagenome]